MILIQEVMLHEDILNEEFLCNLNACKGACCWEGDFGAPLDEEEVAYLDQYAYEIEGHLPPRSREYLKNNEGYEYFKEMKSMGTSLHPDGSCVYLTFAENGIALCGIEKAWREGQIPWRKPISCHLYPIRIETNPQTNFDMLEYDRWEICSAACENGKKHQLAIYEFAKEALIRKYGDDFYTLLEQFATHFKEKRNEV